MQTYSGAPELFLGVHKNKQLGMFVKYPTISLKATRAEARRESDL